MLAGVGLGPARHSSQGRLRTALPLLLDIPHEVEPDMKRTSQWALVAVGLATWGCGPPEVTQALPPGAVARQEIPEDQQAQALGEQQAMGAIQQPTGPVAEVKGLPASPTGKALTTESGLKYETITPGSGDEIRPGQTAVVHYVGTLTNGTEFDSSRNRGQPFKFKVGIDQVIKGWHLGVAGMKKGETRRLTIPPDLAYGPGGSPPVIPPNATLVFDIELLGIE